MSVVVHNIHKRFGPGTPAVNGVSFQAPTGAVTALIGPSGAGKSTVLRAVAGLEIPEQGSIHIGGTDVTALPPQRRGVGLVFQGYALFPHLSVRDNVAFGLDVQRPRRARSEIDDRVQQLLKLVQLDDFGARRPAQLSGGQRQRIAFARALAIEPKVLLLDEPFGALDARVRKDLRDWLLRLHDETRVTTLLVTHDQEEALEVAQHVVVLFGGEVAQAGAPQDIYDRPASPATASFLGAHKVGDAFVQPHDVKLTRAPADAAADAPVARIERIKIVGARARVSLVLRHNGERVELNTGRDQLDALGAAVGDAVLLDVKNARVFLNDWAI